MRAPEGICKQFFSENAGKLAIPALTAIPKDPAGKAAMVINNAEALIGTARMSAVEIHS